VELPTATAVRTDGALVTIRPARLSDRAAISALHGEGPDLAPVTEHCLVAVAGGDTIGFGAFRPRTPTEAELQVFVADGYLNDGLGTLLTEHLVDLARAVGIQVFVADVPGPDAYRVLRDLGYRLEHVVAPAGDWVRFSIAENDVADGAASLREVTADAASLRPLFAPRSVALVGASARPGTVGAGILASLRRHGYTGRIYPVNPKHARLEDLPCYPTVEDLPQIPDLVIIAVPSAHVPDVLDACGRRGVRDVVVVSSGFGETGERELERAVAEHARERGIRLVGPNCLGLLNTAADIRMNATFAELPMLSGGFGIAAQSGAVGIALAWAANERGVGLSQLVTLGNESDVDAADAVCWWRDDPQTTVIGLYLESWLEPRRFVRLVRAATTDKPVFALTAGHSDAGRQAGKSHTAAAATEDVVVSAICAQSGVVLVRTLSELVDVAALVEATPLPQGPRVAVVGNSGGPEILATDALIDAGLEVLPLDERFQSELRLIAPQAANVRNPVDLGGGVDAPTVIQAVRCLVEADDVDAVLLVVAPTAALDSRALTEELAALPAQKTLVLVDLGGSPAVSVFSYPEPAASALGAVWRHVRSRKPTRHAAPVVTGAEFDRARTLLATADPAELLADEVTAELLRCYDIATADQVVVRTEQEAVAAASRLGFPVVAKITGVAHRTELGGVRANVGSTAELRDAVRSLRAVSAKVLIQKRLSGTELFAGAVRHPQCGPLVTLGAGGIFADLFPHKVFRFAPLSDAGLADLLAAVPERLLAGYRGAMPVDREAVGDLVKKLSALISDHPDIAEIDFNPIFARGSSLIVADAKIHRTNHPVCDATAPHLRRWER